MTEPLQATRPAPDYDVVVVGGRVAGGATAMLLARCGHRVLLVDRERPGADTVSTHTILRTGMLQLARWGIADAVVASGAPAIHRVTLGFDSELVPIDLSDDFGVDALYAPRRTVLDPILVAAAVDGGADHLPRSRVVAVNARGDGRVRGVTVDIGDDRVDIGARVVVGADGTFSRVASRVGAAAYGGHEPRNAVYYAYYRGLEVDGVVFQFTAGATAGLIPTNDGEVCVYVGWPAERMEAFRADPEEAFAAQLLMASPTLAAQVAAAERVAQFRGTPGLPAFLRRCGGPGWALVGDAGYTKDPVSAHGISDALRDAELCARAVDRALIDPAAEGAAMAGYQARRDRLSTAMLGHSAELAGYTWDGSRASTLMRGISESVRAECEELLSLPAWAGAEESVRMAG